MKNDNRFFYLYNAFKANFFLQNGCELLEINKGTTGKIFYKFLKTEYSNEVSNRWKEINGFDD